MNNATTVSTLALIVIGSTFSLSSANAYFGDRGENIQHAQFESEEGQHQRRSFRQRGGRNFYQNVIIDVTKTATGIVKTMTTDDSDILEKLHARADRMAERGGRNENVTRTVTKISNGISVAISTSDAETLEKIHGKSDRKVLKKLITKTVQNLDNGVKVSMTSDNSEAVAKLHERADKMGARTPRNENISRAVVKLSNGIEMTIMTTNDELVEKIQMRATKEGRKGRGHGRGHGRQFRGE